MGNTQRPGRVELPSGAKSYIRHLLLLLIWALSHTSHFLNNVASNWIGPVGRQITSVQTETPPSYLWHEQSHAKHTNTGTPCDRDSNIFEITKEDAAWCNRLQHTCTYHLLRSWVYSSFVSVEVKGPSQALECDFAFDTFDNVVYFCPACNEAMEQMSWWKLARLTLQMYSVFSCFIEGEPCEINDHIIFHSAIRQDVTVSFATFSGGFLTNITFSKT